MLHNGVDDDDGGCISFSQLNDGRTCDGNRCLSSNCQQKWTKLSCDGIITKLSCGSLRLHDGKCSFTHFGSFITSMIRAHHIQFGKNLIWTFSAHEIKWVKREFVSCAPSVSSHHRVACVNVSHTSIAFRSKSTTANFVSSLRFAIFHSRHKILITHSLYAVHTLSSSQCSFAHVTQMHTSLNSRTNVLI